MSNWGTLNHHHLPFYSIETFIRAAKNANKTLVICFSAFLHFERTKNHRIVDKVRKGLHGQKRHFVNFLAAIE